MNHHARKPTVQIKTVARPYWRIDMTTEKRTVAALPKTVVDHLIDAFYEPGGLQECRNDDSAVGALARQVWAVCNQWRDAHMGAVRVRTVDGEAITYEPGRAL